ncbi:hypothetical protein D9756_010528 [Leucocoprinus leucothites]|uniref:ASX DEUBAD domain-containing protein n=1 Tax=Leucocoprinus leucothites TaxID=201217 RepID=A0A8H5CX55_9AGAR|nr:hypothetical protein D9756_010528 [Leucoagaricus leucothites]
MTDRPRRSTRQPIKLPATQAEKSGTSKDSTAEPSRSAKRKASEPIDPQTQLRNILENPQSVLTTTDISELINGKNWNLLPERAQQALMALLPSTAFSEDPNHTQDSGHVSVPFQAKRELDLNVFHDTHFLDAAHTFQDHLFSGWFTTSHHAKLVAYLDGIKNGTLAAPWKDEVWERENPRPTTTLVPANAVGSHSSGAATNFGTNTNAGASAELKLSDLVKDGVLRVDDIIAYKRNFSGLGLTVRKDAIIQSTDPLKYTLTVLMPEKATNELPSSLTYHNPGSPGSEIVSVTISTPQMLETHILDTDGRVKKDQRPNGNAWKNFTVYRWREGSNVDGTTDQRGGRDVHGTLFYLRGNHYYDR